MSAYHDVIVIGAGPAGTAAATILAQYKRKCLIVDKGISNSYLASLPMVTYFPAVVNKLSGREILESLRKQAELNGVEFKSGRVTKQKNEVDSISIFLAEGERLKTRAVIIASGFSERTNYLSGEKELFGKGVFHSIRGDGSLFDNRSIAVVGKNLPAAQCALDIARRASKVYFIIPSNRLDVDNNMMRRIEQEKNIESVFSASLKQINGSDFVTSVIIINRGSEEELKVSAVFNYLHEYRPSTDFVDGVIKLSDSKTVLVNEDFSTSHAGCFACGDVLCGSPQEPSISVSQGMIAAQGVNRYLNEIEGKG